MFLLTSQRLTCTRPPLRWAMQLPPGPGGRSPQLQLNSIEAKVILRSRQLDAQLLAKRSANQRRWVKIQLPT